MRDALIGKEEMSDKRYTCYIYKSKICNSEKGILENREYTEIKKYDK